MTDSVDKGPSIGGYDAEFAAALPTEYECPICHLAFRDPVQIEECGHRFCQSCLNELKRRQKGTLTCPLDRQQVDADKIFYDKAARRAVLNLAIKCDNASNKCDWTGELSNLEDHLKSCPYEDIVCPNEHCNEWFPRRTLTHHLGSRCRYRVVNCQFCSDKYVYKDVKSHMKHCKRLPLECINKCGMKDIPRDEMALHISECPLSILPCTYKDIGCVFKGRKNELEEHLKAAVNEHLTMAMQKIRINESRSVCTNGIFIWSIKNFRSQFELARNSEDELAVFSQPFYTSQYGYKLKIKAYLNGRDRGKGTHLSLYLIIMKGEYDALLDWPFNLKITFFLLDQGEQRKHKIHQLSPNRSLPNVRAVFNKPSNRENLGIGNPSFVSHEAIDAGEYVKDDTIFIKCEVEPYSR